MNLRSIGYAFGAAALALAHCAHADNPLVISNALASTDAIAIGFDGPNSPGPSTFYYDLYTFAVDTTGTYSFTMQATDVGLAPWVGVYGGNFSAADYFNPTPIDLAANALGGTTVTMNLLLAAGTYQAVASSVDWIEEPDALDEGQYVLTIGGPTGADIRLVPAPGFGMLALGCLKLASRRSR